MDNLMDIVNGAQLPRFINKQVSIIGKVKAADSNSRSFILLTTDDVSVKINVNHLITGAVHGWVEVKGISRGKEVDANSYLIFSNENFDSKGYNEVCKLLYTVPEIWKTE